MNKLILERFKKDYAELKHKALFIKELENDKDKGREYMNIHHPYWNEEQGCLYAATSELRRSLLDTLEIKIEMFLKNVEEDFEDYINGLANENGGNNDIK